MPRLIRLLLAVAIATSTLLALGAPALGSDNSGQLDPAMVALWQRTDSRSRTAGQPHLDVGAASQHTSRSCTAYAPRPARHSARCSTSTSRAWRSRAGRRRARRLVRHQRPAGGELITGQVQIGRQRRSTSAAAARSTSPATRTTAPPTYATFGLCTRPAPHGAHDAIVAARGPRRRRREPTLRQPTAVRNAPTVNYRAAYRPVGHYDTGHALGLSDQNGAYATPSLIRRPVLRHRLPDHRGVLGARRRQRQPAADVLMQCFERRCLTYTPGNATRLAGRGRQRRAALLRLALRRRLALLRPGAARHRPTVARAGSPACQDRLPELLRQGRHLDGLRAIRARADAVAQRAGRVQPGAVGAGAL